MLDVSSPASQRLAAPTSTTPVTTSGRTPNRPTRRGVTREVAKISSVSGRNAKPERSAPYPSTPCMNCTAKKKNANCAPTKSAITETAPARIRLRSRSSASSGDATRRSLATKPASSTTASANAPTVPTEVQPWSGALMKPKTRLAEPRVAVTAPVTSKRPALARGLVDETVHEDQHEQPERHVDEQRPAPRRVAGEGTAEDQADRAAGGAHRAEEAERPVARTLVRRGAGQERQHARGGDGGADALERTRRHQQLGGGGQAAEQGAEGEDGEAGDERAPSAEHVAEAPAEQQQPAERERVGVEHPGEGRRA